jgi:hypothetical protein
MYLPTPMFARATAICMLAGLAAAAPAAAQSAPFAPWDGTNPFNCVEQDVGTGTEYPDPGADPFCVKFDKTNQNVTDFGIAEFAAQEPTRVAAAGPKCFYFQNDEWTGSIQQGSGPETWHWSGRYFFDKAKGIGGVSVTDYRIGGTPMDATPYVPPEYAGYFAPGGGGGVIVTEETDPDPTCAAKVDTEDEQAAVYSGLPDYGDCVAPGGKIRAHKVGRARLGASPDQVRAKVGPPKKSAGEHDRWCVVGGGRMDVYYDLGEATAIKTTTPGHTFRGVGPGASAADLRKAGFFRFKRHLLVVPLSVDRGVIARVRDGRARWLTLTFA